MRKNKFPNGLVIYPNGLHIHRIFSFRLRYSPLRGGECCHAPGGSHAVRIAFPFIRHAASRAGARRKARRDVYQLVCGHGVWFVVGDGGAVDGDGAAVDRAIPDADI